jgi:hypothetical protein
VDLACPAPTLEDLAPGNGVLCPPEVGAAARGSRPGGGPALLLHPVVMMTVVDTSAAVRFSSLARLLAGEARHHGLVVPGFRSPPRLAGVDRTVRWAADGTCIVSVRVRGRASADVLADLVEGVLVANRLSGQAAEGWRLALHSAVTRLDGGAQAA